MPRPKNKLNVIADNSPAVAEVVPTLPELNSDGVPMLDRKRPCCTRRNNLKYIIMSEGKIFFQVVGTGKAIVTDLYGYDGPKRRVYNGTTADLHRSKRQFAPGESVFIVQPLTRGRKVFAARVIDMEDNRNVVVEILDRDYFPMNASRKYGETGYKVYLPSQVYKTPVEVESYYNGFMKDLEVSMTEHRAALENPKKLKEG